MASFFGDVVDFIFGKTDAFNPDKLSGNVKKNNFSSIAAKASEGILQFPLIVSDTIDYDTVILISKACERSYAAFVQVIFSMNQDLADVDAGNVSDYLKVFHQNDGQSKTDSDEGSLGDIIESFNIDDPSGDTITCEMYCPKNPIMVTLLKEQLRPYIEDFCMTKLNDLYQPPRITNTPTVFSMEGFREPVKPVKYAFTLKEAADKGTDPRNRDGGFAAELISGEVKKAIVMSYLTFSPPV